MADTIYNNKLDLPVSIRRTNNVPLDDRFVFDSYNSASSYVHDTNESAYEGQIIYVQENKTYYSVVPGSGSNGLDLKIIPNTQTITTIDNSESPSATNIHAKVKFNVSDDATPSEREIVFDSTTNELKIGLSSGTQVLSPSWDTYNNAAFEKDVKAETFTIADTTLNEEDFKLINNLQLYAISDFKVEVFDTNQTKTEELEFNFRDGSTWADWALANTSSGFRCVNTDNNSYIRYKNSYLVYTHEQQATEGTGTEIVVTEVEPNDEIVASASKTYYCSPAEATGPITNVIFNDEIGILSWTNPPVDTLYKEIGGIRILYRTDRYPEHESDLMYKFSDDGKYVQESSDKTGKIDLNSSELFIERTNCEINLLSLFKDLGYDLCYDTLYYFYVAPCTSNGFYTESKHQRCQVYIPTPKQEMTASLDDPEANTSNSPLETLLGV